MILPGGVRWTLRIAIAVFAFIVLLPLAIMLVTAFRVDGAWSFAAYKGVLVEARQWSLLGNTVALGLLGTGGAVLLGLPYAFLISRTDLPLRRLFSILYIVPILTPPLILAWGWTRTPDWMIMGNVTGLIGCGFVFALCYFPFVTLLTSHALSSIDAGVEESARLVGGRRAAIWNVTLRLAMPAILSGALLAFVFIISDFALPDFISTIGPKQNVYAGEIFFRAKRLGSSAEATAASLPLLVLTGIALAVILRLRGHRSYAVVGGNFRAPERLRLGLYKLPAFLFCSAVVGLAVIAPFATIIRIAGGLDSFEKAITNPGARKDILTSLGSSVTAATCMVVLGFLLAYAIQQMARRGRRRRSALLEWLAILPLAVPALMAGVGMIRLWNRPQPVFDQVYTTQIIVVLVCIARYIPFAVIAIGSALRQVDDEIEEAGALAGASFLARLRLLLAPLLRDGLFAAWILTFIFSMRELDTMVLIPAGNDSLPFRVFNEIHFGRDPEIAAICLIMVFLISLPLLLYWLVSSRRLNPFA